MEFKHKPVLLEETIEGLKIKEDGIYVDATLGFGGHSGLILKRVKRGFLFAFDQDTDAISYSTKELSQIGDNFKIFYSNFKDLKEHLLSENINGVDGFVFDLGLSSPQIDEKERGFSFMSDAALDMRMDKNGKLTAKDVVNNYSLDELTRIFREYGEEDFSRPIAKNIVNYREENGRFEARNQLLKVAKLGPKAYEQCAGFLRINDGKNPLDATGVHPESYVAAKTLLERLGYTTEDVKERRLDGISKKISNYKKLAEELGVGEITLQDIVKELEKPARDPREDMPKPILRSDVLEMKDLKPGMILKGTVRNVIDFGAFVDIGVHQDGLVHISQMSDRFIKHPLEVVSVGDIVEVKVLDVDLKKQRIALTMKING